MLNRNIRKYMQPLKQNIISLSTINSGNFKGVQHAHKISTLRPNLSIHLSDLGSQTACLP